MKSLSKSYFLVYKDIVTHPLLYLSSRRSFVEIITNNPGSIKGAINPILKIDQSLTEIAQSTKIIEDENGATKKIKLTTFSLKRGLDDLGDEEHEKPIFMLVVDSKQEKRKKSLDRMDCLAIIKSHGNPNENHIIGCDHVVERNARELLVNKNN